MLLKVAQIAAVRKSLWHKVGLYGAILVLISALLMFGCPFYEAFRIPCPCCGVTRAWLAFMRGDIRLAFRYHGLFLLIPPTGALYIAKSSERGLKRQWMDVLLYIMAAAIFVYAILRWCGFVVMP